MTTLEKKQIIESIRELGIQVNESISIKNILYKYIEWVCRNVPEDDMALYGIGKVVESKYFSLHGIGIEDAKGIRYVVVHSDSITYQTSNLGIPGASEKQRSDFALCIPKILQKVEDCVSGKKIQTK